MRRGIALAAFVSFVSGFAALANAQELPQKEKAPPKVAAPAKADLLALHAKARAGGKYSMLLRQWRADEPALGDLHEAGHRDAAGDVPAGFRVYAKPFWFVFRDGPDTPALARQWGPEQACGGPDSAPGSDVATAFATREQDAAEPEWLLLEFAAPVKATAVRVHETLNPGAVARITLFTESGDEVEAWLASSVAAPGTPARVLEAPLPLGFRVQRVRVWLDSAAVKGWNEIDAVGLVDDKGAVHWAAKAHASTTWAEREGAAAAAPVAGAPAVVFLRAAAAVRPVDLKVDVRVVDPARDAVMPPLPQRRFVVRAAPALPPVLPVPARDAELAAQKAANEALQRRVAELEAKLAELERRLRER